MELSALRALALLLLAGTALAATSPFDDLSPAEIQTAVQIIRDSGQFEASAEFPTIRMQEPKKADWLAGRANDTRLAHVSVFEFGSNILTEVVIDLNNSTILTVTPHDEGVAPTLLMSEAEIGERIIRDSSQWQNAITQRGLLLENTVIDIWLPGTLLEHEQGPGKRIVRGLTYYKHDISKFYHWGVVEGLVVMVDLVLEEVVEFWDDEVTNMTSGFEELPDFTTKPILLPLTIEQPEGSTIAFDGQELSWYKWRMRYSIDPIYGLQLYHVTYNADCEDRSVLYKLSIGEMFVPYGGPGRGWRWRSAFDAGEYGFGKNVSPLQVGVDLPENAILIPCYIASETGGDPTLEPGCAAAYERDAGIIYRHQQWNLDGFKPATNDSDDNSVRRGRQLVLTLMTTISNYDYSFDYVFHMDGVIEVKSRLTGIILAKGFVKETNDDEDCLLDCSSLLNDYLIGPPHQHYFSYRIDLDVDGVNNYVAEVDVTADPVTNPDPTYPWDYGMFSPKKTLIPTETHREHNLQEHRSWHVLNADKRNIFGSPRGYALKAGDALAFTYLTEENPVLDRVQFVKHPFWATRYHDDEQQPTSKFPRTGKPLEGLPTFVSDQQSLENEDSVLWYTYGITHSTRPEEWPIMNVHYATGFSLIPFNFFSQNSEMALKDRCP